MFKGVNSPVITILKDDGTIDYANMERHINHLVEAGLNGLLFLGSLGEFYAFSDAERRALIDCAVKTVAGRTQVVIGVGNTAEEAVVRLGNYAAEAGADALNIVSPYYFGLPAAAAVDYFERIANAVELPIMLYNFPDRTGSDLSPEIVREIAQRCPTITGIKDTVDNISHTRRICQAVKPVRPAFSVLSGFDEYYIVNRISGGDGVLCGLTNVVPELFVKMHSTYESGDLAAAVKCAEQIAGLMRIYAVTPLFITGMKAAVRAAGLPISTYTRAPGTTLTEAEDREIRAILADLTVS